jgi:ubiquinone/menaquinone biosynthesis C-methylase UbiE
MAQNFAIEQEVSNVRFEAATAYKLPFPDHSFDAIFSNTLLGHLDNPLAALQEFHRVLKVGGVAGMRAADIDGQIFSPPNPVLARSLKLLGEIIRRRGGNASLGKEMRAWMRQAGFVNVVASASYESYGSQEATKHWGATWSQALQEENNIRQFMDIGAERSEIETMRYAWKEWGNHPDAFFADSFCEVVGWKW